MDRHMEFMEFVDVALQTVVAPRELMMVIKPSPLSAGDGKCRVVIGSAVVEITAAEAARLQRDLMERL